MKFIYFFIYININIKSNTNTVSNLKNLFIFKLIIKKLFKCELNVKKNILKQKKIFLKLLSNYIYIYV